MSSLFYPLVPSLAVPASDASKISNVSCSLNWILSSSLWKQKKTPLLVCPLPYFLFYISQKNSLSCCIAVLHPAFFSATSTLPSIWILLSITELELEVFYTVRQRKELFLTMLLDDWRKSRSPVKNIHLDSFSIALTAVISAPLQLSLVGHSCVHLKASNKVGKSKFFFIENKRLGSSMERKN